MRRLGAEKRRKKNMKLIYYVKDKPSFGKVVIFALQQLLAILAATIAVPTIVQNGMSQSAALFGAGIGTLGYLLFTKFRSPVFLGSSFAFIGSMLAAFAGAVSAEAGHAGLIIGAAFAGIVYVIIAIIVKFVGVGWINKLMPAVVIGPTVSIIGLSLAANAVSDITKGKVLDAEGNSAANPLICLLCGLITLLVVTICSVYGKKMVKLIPFIIGILAGYAAAAIFTVIGIATDNPSLQIINFEVFRNMGIVSVPDFTFLEAAKGFFLSSEFLGKKLSDQEFVTRCYRTFLNREPDAQGLKDWNALLAKGDSRESILDGFIGSGEYAKLCVSYGIDR